ncbi:MAG: lysostaphin resistance A-like protein [Pseudomonadales bacterium]
MAARIGMSVAAAALAIVWLVALGAGSALPSPWSFIVLLLVLCTFWALHCHRDWPNGWHRFRLRGAAARWWIWALVMGLMLTGWRLAIALHTPWPDESPNPNLLWTTLAAVLAAPIIEEFGFRLWLQGQLERWLPGLLAIVLAAATFAAVHDLERWYLHGVSGMLYGLALWRSGSIWVPVAMHGLANAAIATLQWRGDASEQLQIWSQQQPPWLAEATIGLTALLLAGALWTFRQAPSPNAAENSRE